MSDKDRRKKDGQDKNKKNQARRKAEANAGSKRTKSSREPSSRRTRRISGEVAAENTGAISSAPPAARAYASKARKGK
jgi:hypothetical protein